MKKSVNFGGVFGESWNLMWDKFGVLGMLGLMFSFLPGFVFAVWDNGRTKYIVDGVTPTINNVVKEFFSISPALFLMWLFSTFLIVSVVYFLNYGKKKKKMNTESAIKGGCEFYLKALGLGAVLFIFLIPLYMLLVIPGIIFQVYWIFATYVLVAEKTSVFGALNRSKDIVKGKWWMVFGYAILFYIIIGIFSSVLNGLFSMFGNFGIPFQVLVNTITAIFSMVFINNFYLKLKK